MSYFFLCGECINSNLHRCNQECSMDYIIIELLYKFTCSFKILDIVPSLTGSVWWGEHLFGVPLVMLPRWPPRKRSSPFPDMWQLENFTSTSASSRTVFCWLDEDGTEGRNKIVRCQWPIRDSDFILSGILNTIYIDVKQRLETSSSSSSYGTVKTSMRNV